MKKNSLLLNISVILLAGVLFSSSSCKKDDDEDPLPNPGTPEETGSMLFHIHNYVDIEEVFGYGFPYFTSTENRQITLSIGQFYISGIELVKPNGSVVSVPGKILLKVQEDETYDVGQVPVGNYKSVRFKIGVDAATNSSVPAAGSLLESHQEMWFGNASQPDGFVFFNAQGSIDTTVAADGSGITPFAYRIGTNNHYVQIVMPDKPFSITTTQAGFAHILADYSLLFSNINLRDITQLSVTSASDNQGWVADTVAGNISRIFRYE